MKTTIRRYDIDWVRVIAIGLLLIYHVAIGFQPWGIMIGFITSEQPWESLWIPMAMLNVWRIPLLFFVSGMGVYFALHNRNWKQLIRERAGRILLPFLVGIVMIVPIHVYLWQSHNQFALSYNPNSGHLWFLGHIFIYVVVLSPLFIYLKRNEGGQVVQLIKRVFSSPLGLLPVVLALVAESLILNPRPYELYATTWHGFFLGLLAFFFGFCFVLGGEPFWKMLLRWRWLFLLAAAGFFTYRITQYPMSVPVYLLPIESLGWVLSVLAFGYRYLNRPGKMLSYLSRAAYPVYILHMIFLYLGSMLVFPLEIAVPMQFVLVLSFTIVGCFASYEMIRRVPVLRPLFGLRLQEKEIPVLKEVRI